MKSAVGSAPAFVISGYTAHGTAKDWPYSPASKAISAAARGTKKQPATRSHSENGVVAARADATPSRARDADGHLRLSIITRHGHENRVSTVERAYGRRREETLGLDAAHRDAAAGARETGDVRGN